MALQELRFRFGPLLGQQPQFQVIQEPRYWKDGIGRIIPKWPKSSGSRILYSVHAYPIISPFSMIELSFGGCFSQLFTGYRILLEL